MLIRNGSGNFSFLSGIEALSFGCVADQGFEIVYATLRPAIPLEQGFAFARRHLTSLGRPLNALCGMQLRIPKPFTHEGFEQFNRGYLKYIDSMNLRVGGISPVARTNVALTFAPVPEPSVSAFFYTIPSGAKVRTFVLSGAAELRSWEGGKVELVAPGDVSARGMKLKADSILELLTSRLKEFAARWDDVSTVNLYTVHDIAELIDRAVLPAIGGAARLGITVYRANPPVENFALEIDARATLQELVIPA